MRWHVARDVRRSTARDGYSRRRPERSVLHRRLGEHVAAFRERADEHGGLPQFVERDVRVGILSVIAATAAARGKSPECKPSGNPNQLGASGAIAVAQPAGYWESDHLTTGKTDALLMRLSCE
jgi:hypothetical protein